jgi:hypothetical protein
MKQLNQHLEMSDSVAHQNQAKPANDSVASFETQQQNYLERKCWG